MADQRPASNGYLLECDLMGCDVCNLGPLPGESRAEHVARLRMRFVGRPIPGLQEADDGIGQPIPFRPVPVLVACERCGGERRRGVRCTPCAVTTWRRRREERLA